MMETLIEDIHSAQVDITGLKELLRNKGFVLPPTCRSEEDPNGLVVLIKGKPGTGKSTLALQIVFELVRELVNRHSVKEFKDKNAKFYSLEQKTDDIAIKYATLMIYKEFTEELCNNYEAYESLSEYYIGIDPNNRVSIFDLVKKSFIHEYIGKISDCLINNQCEIDMTISLESVLESIQDALSQLIKDSTTEIISKLTDSINNRIKNLYENFKRIDFEKYFSINQNPESPYKHLSSPISKVVDIAESLDNTDGVLPLVAIDGLNIIGTEDIKQINLHQIINLLRRKALFTFIAYEPSKNDADYLEYLVDMVIHLQQNTIDQPITYSLNEISISKARYQDAVLGWHQYKIRDYGIEVFPSTHFQVHHPYNMIQQLNESKIHVRERTDISNISEKKPSILENVIQIQPGSFTVILGARATFKTTFTLDFLFSGAKIGESGLLLSLIDNRESIIKNLQKCPRIDGGCEYNCHKKLFHFQQRPGCITPSEFLYYLNQRIDYHSEQNKIKRVVFWDLTQIEFRFPLFSSDPMFLPSLMDYFRKKEISAIIMGSGNASLTKAAAAMADNVLFCWRDTLREERLKNKKGLPKSFSTPTKSLYKEFIALYVDRCAEKLGNEGKILHTFPVDENKEIIIPKCVKVDEVLTMQDYAIKNESVLTNAEEKIKSIVRMQGIGDVK